MGATSTAKLAERTTPAEGCPYAGWPAGEGALPGQRLHEARCGNAEQVA